MADSFDALAHPFRRLLIEELRDGPHRAGDLGATLPISREAVGKHLRVLAAAGVLTREVRGREHWYALDPDALRPVDDWLEPYRAFWNQRLDALETEIARGRRTVRADQRAADDPPAPAAPATSPDPSFPADPAPTHTRARGA